MVFLDSNVPMYLIGAPHPNQLTASGILQSLVSRNRRLVCDAEVFQEILHRYTMIGRREAIQPAFSLLEGFCDEVFPVSLEDVQKAKNLVNAYPQLSSRDAIHAAIMAKNAITEIVSFDKGYDTLPGITRIAAL